ncbi:MAG: hypothetical protein JW855_00240 [Gammaproteobacteria bacterium]|nr:hypothetical protein [Gammaproteobacteria bacterium]
MILFVGENNTSIFYQFIQEYAFQREAYFINFGFILPNIWLIAIFYVWLAIFVS